MPLAFLITQDISKILTIGKPGIIHGDTVIFKLLPKHQTFLSSMVSQNHPGIPTVGTQTSAFTQPATRVDASGWHLSGSHQMARGPVEKYSKISKDPQGSCFEHVRTLDANP